MVVAGIVRSDLLIRGDLLAGSNAARVGTDGGQRRLRARTVLRESVCNGTVQPHEGRKERQQAEHMITRVVQGGSRLWG